MGVTTGTGMNRAALVAAPADAATTPIATVAATYAKLFEIDQERYQL